MPQETDQQERDRLSKLPFLTALQRRSLQDPSFSLKLCNILVNELRRQSAADFERKSQGEKTLARAFGQVEHVAVNDGASFGGQLREVPRG